jgi:hypothetical protein
MIAWGWGQGKIGVRDLEGMARLDDRCIFNFIRPAELF